MPECYDLYNQVVAITDQTVFVKRTAVYAIIFLAGTNKILVQRLSTSKRLVLPGGGVNEDESLQEALKREVGEETSLEITIIKQLHLIPREYFWFGNDSKRHFRQQSFFFKALTQSSFIMCQDPKDLSEAMFFIDINKLKPEDFQLPLGKIWQELTSRL